MKSRCLLIGAALCAALPVVHAQLSLVQLNQSYTVTFDSTVTGVNSGQFAGTGFQANPNTGQLDSDAWAVTGWTNGALAFGGTQTTTNTDYTRGNVTAAVTTGGMYAYGSTDRMLMIQPGGSDWAPGTLTLRIQNNTGSALTSMSVGYDLWVRNDQARSNSFNFSYSATNATYTSAPSLAYTSTAASDGSFTQIFSAGSTGKMTISGLTIATGDYFYLRWSGADVGGSGSRDEFFLDNISVTASAVPEPSTYAAIFGALALVGVIVRRRVARA
jgi:hypothetical protein